MGSWDDVHCHNFVHCISSVFLAVQLSIFIEFKIHIMSVSSLSFVHGIGNRGLQTCPKTSLICDASLSDYVCSNFFNIFLASISSAALYIYSLYGHSQREESP
jgi:hypothetical protein